MRFHKAGHRARSSRARNAAPVTSSVPPTPGETATIRAPLPGDIIIARVPDATPDQPGRFKLPCLVLNAEPAAESDAPSALQVSRGSSNRNHRIFPSEILIDNADGNSARLIHPTKFDIAQPATIDWSSQYCDFPRGKAPIIGRLGDLDMARLEQIALKVLRDNQGLDLGRQLLPAPPSPGDIVMLYSPYQENPNKPASECHPCLVTAVEAYTDAQGYDQLAIRHAPCTTARLETGAPGDLVVRDPVTLAAAGLDRPSRIRLSQIRRAPWTPDYIHPRMGGPRIGRLPQRELDACLLILDRVSPDQVERQAATCQSAIHRPRDGHER